MTSVTVFDPAMCCSTGVCGPAVDPALTLFAADLDWLAGQGVAAAAAESFLRATGGRPDDALALAHSGRSPQAWAALPQAVARGDVTALGDWAPAQVIDALQKLCHDLLAASVGAAPSTGSG